MTDGNGNGNGNNPGPLASLAGAKVKLVETTGFDVRDLDQALKMIKQLGASGTLTIPFLRGGAAGQAEFKTNRKE